MISALGNRMLANVSHELGSQLTLCAAPLQTLLAGEAGPLTERQEYLVGVAQSSAQKIIGLVNGLLDLAWIEEARILESGPRLQNLQPSPEQMGFDIGIVKTESRRPMRSEPPRQGPKVLLVEDNDEMASFIEGVLEDDYLVLRAGDGREARKLALERDPDVIVSDLIMPDMDAFSLCRLFKADPALAPIPIVMLTAQGDHGSVVAGWEAGVDDYLVKPFQVHELRVRVRSLVQFRASHRALASRTEELEEANRKLLESQEQTIQASKLAAVGQLAAGVAHELNNPLTTVLGFAQSLAKRLEPSGTQRVAVDSIVRESKRASELVRDLLAFSRASGGEKQPVEVDTILTQVRSLCEHRARLQSISLTVTSTAGGRRVVGDLRRLEQVLINLINNAMDVLAAGGAVKLDAESVDGEITFRVSDNGPGVPEALRRKIFEPFFTTKPAGKGTGLGLALCNDIVRDHKGGIEVSNAPGGGACFTVRLPECSASEKR